MIPIRMYAYAGALVALIAFGWWGYDHVYAKGAASRDAEVATLNGQIAVDATTMKAITADTDAAKARADAQQSQAQAIIDGLTQADKAKQTTFAASIVKDAAARNTTDCAAAKVKICAALLDY